jgi:hypothetical protein
VTSAQWEFAEVSNVSDSYHTPDFRFKFEFESDGGNYLYIDDININGSPVGIEDVAQASSEPMVVPNPARGQAQLMFNLETSGMVELEMLDVLGRSITTLKAGQMAAGLHRLDLPVSSLQSGLYFIRMQQGASKKVVRFIVE